VADENAADCPHNEQASSQENSVETASKDEIDVGDQSNDEENNETTSTEQASTKKKRKRKKKKGGAAGGAAAAAKDVVDGEEQANSINPPRLNAETLQKAFASIMLNESALEKEKASKKHFEFWDTQPVPKLDDKISLHTNESVEGDKQDIRQEPFSLPPGFEWDTLDLGDEDQLKELYTLLNENYVEDDDNMFRFDYSPTFLSWALRPPGFKNIWHCAVRVSTNKKLVGFISGVPAKIKVYEKHVNMVEINFLCVHKKLRSKRVAPVLIREITRRVNLEGIFQAVYTAGIVLPKPVGTCRYWHRSINPKKLIEVKFSHLKRNMTMQRTIKLYRLPERLKDRELRPLTEADVPSGHKLLSNYLAKFDLAPMFDEEEFKHWFLPKDGVVTAYIKTDNSDNVTDMFSFYQLPSTIVDHPKYKTLKAAYSFYNVATTMTLKDLLSDALIVARNDGFDVFNALNLMENEEVLEELKFGIGDGNLNYYIYNWKCPTIPPQKVGLVLQ